MVLIVKSFKAFQEKWETDCEDRVLSEALSFIVKITYIVAYIIYLCMLRKLNFLKTNENFDHSNVKK